MITVKRPSSIETEEDAVQYLMWVSVGEVKRELFWHCETSGFDEYLSKRGISFHACERIANGRIMRLHMIEAVARQLRRVAEVKNDKTKVPRSFGADSIS